MSASSLNESSIAKQAVGHPSETAYPIAVTTGIQKAFLQIQICECVWDASRFHWKKSEIAELEVLHFTRALFSLAPLPFLLGGVIEAHLDAWQEREPEMVAELRHSSYIDGGQNASQVQQHKEAALQIFNGVKPSESKMLGPTWTNQQHTLAVVIHVEEVQPTKGGILGKIVKIYDPLGLMAR